MDAIADFDTSDYFWIQIFSVFIFNVSINSLQESPLEQ